MEAIKSEPEETKLPDQKQQFAIWNAKRILAIAPSQYGKTHLILDYLKKIVKSKQVEPQRVVMFSKTYKSDPVQLKFFRSMQKMCPNKYKYKENNCLEDIDESFLKKLYSHQKEMKDKGRPVPPWILVYDDQITSDAIKSDIMIQNFCIGRHYNISSIFMLQKLRGTIPTKCRSQTTDLLIGLLPSVEDIEDILRAWNYGYGSNKKEAYKAIYDDYMDAVHSRKVNGRPCGFLHINTVQQFGFGRISRNFDDYYYDIKKV